MLSKFNLYNYIEVYLSAMRPAVDAGRADVALELMKMIDLDGKPPDNSFSFVCRTHAHLFVGDVAAAVSTMRQCYEFMAKKTAEQADEEPQPIRWGCTT